jgi:hypothetical protein
VTVYITDKGDCYHSRPDCGAITGAQRTAVTMGWRAYPVEEVPLAEAVQRGKAEPCQQCR